MRNKRNAAQRALLLEERATLLQTKSPGSAVSSCGTARLVASYSVVECIGGGGGYWECTVGVCSKESD
jgi:hypothetical protein